MKVNSLDGWINHTVNFVVCQHKVLVMSPRLQKIVFGVLVELKITAVHSVQECTDFHGIIIHRNYLVSQIFHVIFIKVNSYVENGSTHLLVTVFPRFSHRGSSLIRALVQDAANLEEEIYTIGQEQVENVDKKYPEVEKTNFCYRIRCMKPRYNHPRKLLAKSKLLM